LSRKVWKRKKKVYDSVNMTIVTPSRWLAGCAKSSSLLAGKRIEVIPNGLDTEKFRPMNKAEARHLLGLPEDANLVLYCGIHSTVDANKGADLLLEALQGQASQMANCFDLVLLGTTACLGFETLGIKVHTLGRLVDEVSLRIAYASADLLVLPSREESLSYTVMEAMACGVPCVAFDGNGASDLIDHMSTGYLVKPYDTEELGISILRLLGDRLQLDTMAQKSRKKIVEGYDQKHIANRYLNLYQSMV
jgi:glycosyltransferase involved in cell wall biosynthesis